MRWYSGFRTHIVERSKMNGIKHNKSSKTHGPRSPNHLNKENKLRTLGITNLVALSGLQLQNLQSSLTDIICLIRSLWIKRNIRLNVFNQTLNRLTTKLSARKITWLIFRSNWKMLADYWTASLNTQSQSHKETRELSLKKRRKTLIKLCIT